MHSAISPTSNQNNPAPAGSFHEPILSGRRRENLIGQKQHKLEVLSFSRTEKQPGHGWTSVCGGRL